MSWASGRYIPHHIRQKAKGRYTIMNLNSDLDCVELCRGCREGDVLALEILDQMAHYIAICIFNIYQMLNVNLFVFGGGMVPWYILLSNYLHLSNSYAARIFPALMSPFLIILMRTFMQSSVPVEIIESVKVDGAGDFKIYTHIILPVITPAIATVGLFLAVGYWNEWYLTSLFISKKEMYSLQYFLYDVLNSINYIRWIIKFSLTPPPSTPVD